ncbi:MAG TPA: PadR family transcriptional regulator, partial [Chloroflexota bacterium]|nr:PadR family transcriptional regulator [Chloroflexota bacterium]
MAIRFVILGFLEWESLTGYDLKKRFAVSETFHWSGNNNQIYTALIQLYNEGLVSKEVQDQESGPSRKVYSITPDGRAALRQWLLTPPELPQLRHPFLAQLAWADQLTAVELDHLLSQYENEVYVKLLMAQEQAQRDAQQSPHRTPREGVLWDQIAAYWQS